MHWNRGADMPPSYRQALGIGDDYCLEVTPGDEIVVYGVGMEREHDRVDEHPFVPIVIE
jgi:hypothetical protein